MCVCHSGRGFANISSTNGEVCTMYTLHTSSAYQQLPPVFYSTHGIFSRLFGLHSTANLSAQLGTICSAHTDGQTDTLVDTHTWVACWYHGDESLITHNTHTQVGMLLHACNMPT